jgi:hypothetical protein
VEGFSILASQLDSGADLAVSEGAHHLAQRGRTILCFWQLELGYLLHSGVAIVPGSYCILFTVKDISSTSYIHYISKLVFPGGVLSRVMLTKNTCVYTCILVAVISS